VALGECVRRLDLECPVKAIPAVGHKLFLALVMVVAAAVALMELAAMVDSTQLE
jgi:hypothetical protein